MATPGPFGTAVPPEPALEINIEASRHLSEVAARQMTQRGFKYRRVLLQHNGGKPIRFNRPKVSKKQLARLRKEQITARRHAAEKAKQEATASEEAA